MSATTTAGAIRTLIVDDDFRVAAIHRGFIERLPSFSVVGVAHTARDALVRAEGDRPDLVLLDIYLPDRSGLEVLRELHSTGRPPVDVIAITAANDVETLRSALQGGVVHYLVKPFQFNAFREKLESYAALRSRLRQVREVDQDEIDEVLATLRAGSSSPALPKGLSPATFARRADAARHRRRSIRRRGRRAHRGESRHVPPVSRSPRTVRTRRRDDAVRERPRPRARLGPARPEVPLSHSPAASRTVDRISKS